MIISKLLTVATAILLPASLVIAAPGAPFNPQAPARSGSSLVAQTPDPAPHNNSNPIKLQANGSKRTVARQNDAPAKPAILDAEPVGVVYAQTGDVPYAHGWCSFQMQLFDQCVHNPEENWHEELLGMLTSIQDNDHKTVVEYPEGAGRIDRGAIRLLGMGDFRLAWNKADKQMYFMFNNGWWASNTKHEASSFGFCNWTAWSKPDLVCIPAHGTHYRVSNMACVFKC